MKITALLVLKCNPEGSDPTILANASDVTRFGYFQRPSVREFIVFVGRTVGKRTPPGQRQSVQHEEYKVHSYNRNGLCTVGFMDDHYPVRSAFSLLNKVNCCIGNHILLGRVLLALNDKLCVQMFGLCSTLKDFVLRCANMTYNNSIFNI
ncbi:VAMP-like protein YKT61 isoform X1 [Camellia sinensis]|uniref:VAMP-like protein YKT61 isoform X1 n=1 Tax=Camellia sinensis TaxID=4442 RepID=UPI001036E7BF|nr:VAMP-like protein YKT61 isoform X1 [Camellia sinensis]